MEIAVHTERGKTRGYENIVKAVTEGREVHMTRLSDGEEEEITVRGSIFTVAEEEYEE